jgi:hypothetical protein
MDISKFLSKVVGIYLMIVSIAMFLNMPQFIIHVNSLINDPPLLFVTGFFTLILGILMVVSHHIWQWNWRVIITIFAWIVLLKGASIIFYPQFIDKTTLLFIHHLDATYVGAGFDFVIGILLSYVGFKH